MGSMSRGIPQVVAESIEGLSIIIGGSGGLLRFGRGLDVAEVIDEALGEFLGHEGEGLHHHFGHEGFWGGVECHCYSRGLVIELFEGEVAEVV